MKNLMEALLEEISRNEQLLAEYKNIGPAGMFGATMISNNLDTAKKAITENDTIGMIKIFKELQENQ